MKKFLSIYLSIYLSIISTLLAQKFLYMDFKFLMQMKSAIFLLLLLLSFQVNAQDQLKNNIYSTYSHVTGDRYSGGSFIGQGYTIGYRRYLKDRIYADFSYGRLDYEGQNSVFFLSKEETGRFDMHFFTLGFGYDLVQKEKFILSTEASFLRIRNRMLESQIGEGDNITFRQTNRFTDVTARVGLKARFFLTDNLQLIPSIAYGFQIEQFETSWLNIGLGYSF
ncbi:hypothetical protein SAMN06295967_11569 [Belliella buryatensis]|uniref:Outer membrane protein beta-barrel domain-containing protein n=1 Tax=Belliella buryatensis TaxID=1500549 RepID=A0A239GAL5_9BACT|nr:hypothetical protein [Belliella buryatensis]SNS66140.1 hypothetical protein SAMN06295967_11569 [Belliella buryatensis]